MIKTYYHFSTSYKDRYTSDLRKIFFLLFSPLFIDILFYYRFVAYFHYIYKTVYIFNYTKNPDLLLRI